MLTTVRKVVWMAGALLLATAMMTSSTVVSANGPDLVRVSAKVNGIESPVAPGSLVAKGTLKADGACDTPLVTLETAVSKGGPKHVSVSVETSPQCEMIVKEVSSSSSIVQPPSRPGNVKSVNPAAVNGSPAPGRSAPMGALETTYRVWAESVYRDVARLALTTAHGELQYKDSGSQVYGGSNPNNYCWWLPDGWSLDSCSSTWDPNGTSEVWSEDYGSFHFTGNNWPHSQSARAIGLPGDSYSASCSHQGDTVPGGLWTCDSGR